MTNDATVAALDHQMRVAAKHSYLADLVQQMATACTRALPPETTGIDTIAALTMLLDGACASLTKDGHRRILDMMELGWRERK